MSKLIKIAFAIFLVPFLYSLSAIAQQQNVSDTARKSELRQIERKIEIKKNHNKELKDFNKIIADEIKSYGNELVVKARRISVYEKYINASTRQIEKLTAEEQLIKNSLDSNNEILVETIIAMLRIGSNQPPSLVVNNNKMYDSIRAAKLLGSILPTISADAKTLQNEIAYMRNIREQLQQKRKKLAQNYKMLQKKYGEINVIVTERQKLHSNLIKQISKQEKIVKKLDLEAKNLKELLTKLSRLKLRSKKLAKVKLPPWKNTALKPAQLFEKTRGTLILPVNGKIIKKFGDSDLNGERSKGIYIKTPSYGQVVSPIDGLIEYANEFGDYGWLVIIDVGQGYRVLLAGMRRIYVNAGYFVLKGEPVGLMGETALASLAVGSVVNTKTNQIKKRENATLYVEFRKNEDPTDSEPWWNKKSLNKG